MTARGFTVRAGDLGENVTTQGLDLLALPTGASIRLGDNARVRVTGLRNPCAQLDGLRDGLMAAVLERDAQGHLVRRAGVMAVVVAAGEVRPGDPAMVTLPDPPYAALEAM